MQPPSQANGAGAATTGRVVAAGLEHMEAVIEAVRGARFAVSPLRPWTVETVREWLIPLVRARWKSIIENPAYETLVVWDGERVDGWIVMQHDTIEGATGHPQTTIIPPSHITTPALLHETMRRARARGSKIVSGNVLINDEVQLPNYEAAGLIAEFQRIILPLEGHSRNHSQDARRKAAFERATRSVCVRRAELTDRLSLLRLAGECVNMMFHDRRDADIELIQGRFIESYANIDVDDETHHIWIAETPEMDLCGALQIDARHDHLLDGTWQAYISDISVLPEYWGRAVGVALVLRGIDALAAAGIKYLAGDISTTNERVWSLSQKFGFHIESYHYVGLLEEEAL